MGATRFVTLLCSMCVFLFVMREARIAGMGPRFAATATLSLLSFLLSTRFIVAMCPLFERARMGGKDINKRGTHMGDRLVPEPLGLIPAAVYLLVLCCLHLFGYLNGNTTLYTAALASVTFMILLGFVDDVLDLRWRYKLILPLIASMPLLVHYTGGTSVLLPSFVRPMAVYIAKWFGGGIDVSTSGRLVNVGFLYYMYMALLSIFCTNAINIYAGINGLEAGQSVIIAAFVLMHNALTLNPNIPKDNIDLLRTHHAFSIDMMMPFAAVTLGLLRYNWYPSSVFVGDTFCYFAGMTFAMASILGHYSETLLVFFIPQLINFVYSLPQLLGIVHCPRHRLPRYNKSTDKLEGIPSNLNLVNLVLLITGPLHEQTLCILLLAFQVLCCSGGLLLRASVVRYLST